MSSAKDGVVLWFPAIQIDKKRLASFFAPAFPKGSQMCSKDLYGKPFFRIKLKNSVVTEPLVKGGSGDGKKRQFQKFWNELWKTAAGNVPAEFDFATKVYFVEGSQEQRVPDGVEFIVKEEKGRYESFPLESKVLAMLPSSKKLISGLFFIAEQKRTRYLVSHFYGNATADLSRVGEDDKLFDLFITDAKKAASIMHKSGIIQLDLKPINIARRKDGGFSFFDFDFAYVFSELPAGNHDAGVQGAWQIINRDMTKKEVFCKMLTVLSIQSTQAKNKRFKQRLDSFLEKLECEPAVFPSSSASASASGASSSSKSARRGTGKGKGKGKGKAREVSPVAAKSSSGSRTGKGKGRGKGKGKAREVSPVAAKSSSGSRNRTVHVPESELTERNAQYKRGSIYHYRAAKKMAIAKGYATKQDFSGLSGISATGPWAAKFKQLNIQVT